MRTQPAALRYEAQQTTAHPQQAHAQLVHVVAQRSGTAQPLHVADEGVKVAVGEHAILQGWVRQKLEGMTNVQSWLRAPLTLDEGVKVAVGEHAILQGWISRSGHVSRPTERGWVGGVYRSPYKGTRVSIALRKAAGAMPDPLPAAVAGLSAAPQCPTST